MITVRLSQATDERVDFRLDRAGGPSHDLTFTSDSLALVPSGDAALVAALPLAMAAREPLRVEVPVSARLHGAVATVLDVLAVWWRTPEPMVPVEAEVGDPRPRGHRHGGVFSHDLSSFHLAVADASPDLLFAVDADLPAGVEPERAGPDGQSPVISTNLAEVGAAFGLDWNAQYRGAALAAAAHVAAELGRVDLPAPFSVHYLFPWGSHAVLDPLWSGDGLEVRHRHAEVDWMDRLRVVSERPSLQDRIRVCLREAAPNACGSCRGCLYLDAGLSVLGRGGDRPLDLEGVRGLDLRHHTDLADTAVLLRHADRDADAELVAAVEDAVRRLGPADVQWPDNWYAHLAELGSGSA